MCVSCFEALWKHVLQEIPASRLSGSEPQGDPEEQEAGPEGFAGGAEMRNDSRHGTL